MVQIDKADDGTYTISGLTNKQLDNLAYGNPDDEVVVAIGDQLFAEKIEARHG